jgi:hypothetical protein
VSPTRIVDLKVHEVSSVPHGAGKTRVLITKSAKERNQTMDETLGVVSIAKRAPQALADGTLTQEAYAKLQQRLAQEQFPNDSIGVALSKFFATPHGAEMLNRGLQQNYEEVQKRVAVGNGYIQKDGEVPHPRRASPRDTDDDDEDDGGSVEQKVRRLMDKHNLTYDQAITRIHRAEKIAKGIV